MHEPTLTDRQEAADALFNIYLNDFISELESHEFSDDGERDHGDDGESYDGGLLAFVEQYSNYPGALHP